MTLTDFLLARLADDEAVARECSTGPWVAWADGSIIAPDASPTYLVSRAASWNAPHIARHDPARVLAEVAAKRRIVEDATNQHTSCVELDWVVSVLAQPYSDHPDFREEWRA